MQVNECKYCGAKAYNGNDVCYLCMEKLRLLRQIRAMLMPYYKGEGAKDGKQKKGL